MTARVSVSESSTTLSSQLECNGLEQCLYDPKIYGVHGHTGDSTWDISVRVPLEDLHGVIPSGKSQEDMNPQLSQDWSWLSFKLQYIQGESEYQMTNLHAYLAGEDRNSFEEVPLENKHNLAGRIYAAARNTALSLPTPIYLIRTTPFDEDSYHELPLSNLGFSLIPTCGEGRVLQGMLHID